jgi:hypothetical protein
MNKELTIKLVRIVWQMSSLAMKFENILDLETGELTSSDYEHEHGSKGK